MPLPPEENGAGTKERATQRDANTPAKPPARYLPFAQSLAQSLSTPSFRMQFLSSDFTEVYTADSMPQILFKWRSYSLNCMKILVTESLGLSRGPKCIGLFRGMVVFSSEHIEESLCNSSDFTRVDSSDFT